MTGPPFVKSTTEKKMESEDEEEQWIEGSIDHHDKSSSNNDNNKLDSITSLSHFKCTGNPGCFSPGESEQPQYCATQLFLFCFCFPECSVFVFPYYPL